MDSPMKQLSIEWCGDGDLLNTMQIKQSYDDLPNVSSILDAKNSIPSVEGWTSMQNITIANIKLKTNLSNPKDTTKFIKRQCSMKKIQRFKTELSNRRKKYECNNINNNEQKSQHNLINKENVSNNIESSNIETLSNKDVDTSLDTTNVREVDKEEFKHNLEAKENVEVMNSSEPLSKNEDINTMEDIEDTANSLRDINIRKIDEEPFMYNLENKENIDITNDSKPSNIREVDKDALMRDVEKVELSNIASDSDKLSFMASLQDGADITKVHVDALELIVLFAFKRKKLMRRLFKEFNSLVFDSKLDDDMSIVWSTRIWSTAGSTILTLTTSQDGSQLRQASIKLSSEVVNTPQRLRDVLIHELCHAAVWLIDGKFSIAHGAHWKKWVNRALKVFPELGEINRLHDYEINYKYIYKCTTCPGSHQRRTKPKNTVEYCCRRCQGRLQLFVSPKFRTFNKKRHSPENIFSVIGHIIEKILNM